MRNLLHRVRFFGFCRLCVLNIAVGSLAACASHNSSDTAFELIQQQKDEQAQIQQHNDEVARRQTPTQPALMLSLIREAQAQGRYFAALAYTDAYIQKYGSDEKVLSLRADALRMTGQGEQSQQAYRTLIQSGQAAHGWHGLGLLAGGSGNYVEAIDDLQHAAKLAPTDPQILSDLGFARLSNGDIAGARLPLGQAAELDPTNSQVLSNFALLLMAEGDAVGAQRVMDKSALSPEARQRIFQLSASLQARRVIPRAASSAPLAVVVSDSSGTPTPIARTDPPMLSPMLERFGNGSSGN